MAGLAKPGRECACLVPQRAGCVEWVRVRKLLPVGCRGQVAIAQAADRAAIPVNFTHLDSPTNVG